MMESLSKLGYSKVLVTGGRGFIGSHLVRDLLDQELEVFVLSPNYKQGTVNRSALPENPRLKILENTVNKIDQYAKVLVDTDAIVHLAAITEIPLSLEDPSMTFEVNHAGFVALLELARRIQKLRQIVLVSSEQVYSMPPSYLPIDEKHPVDPSTPYGLSKLQQEQLALLYNRCYDLPITILRSGLLFGERQKDKGINHLIKRAITNQPITIEGGAQTRDIYHVGNLVHAIGLAFSRKAEGEILNIGGKFEISVRQLVDKIVKFTESKSEIKYADYRKNEGPTTRMSLDISKAQKLLSYSPVIGFEQGLARTVGWLSRNLDRYSESTMILPD